MQDDERMPSLKHWFSQLTTLKVTHIIVIVGLVVFGNMLFNGFVWDDIGYIVNVPQMHHINLAYSFGTNDFNGVGQYRPIPAVYFSVLYALFGAVPFPFHLLQLVLHITCSILVYILFRKYALPPIALFFALVFLVHPLNVESVSYIAQSTSPLFTLSAVIAMLLLMQQNLTGKKVVLGSVLILVSLLTKETAFMIPLLLILYAILFHRKNIKILSLTGGVSLVTYFLIRLGVGHVGFFSSRPLAPVGSLSLYERLLNMPQICFYYFSNFLFPNRLAVDQQWVIPAINVNTFYLPLICDGIFLSILGVFGIYLFKRQKQYFKIYLFFFVWFISGLFFLLQVVPLDGTVADRWFYLPMAGLLGMFSIMVQCSIQNVSKYKTLIVLVAITIILLLSVRTIVRNTNWYDAITLFSHDINVSDSFDIESRLGMEYFDNNEFNEALPHYLKSVEQRPYVLNIQSVGATYLSMGDIQNATKYEELALHANNYELTGGHKTDRAVYHNYGLILLFGNDPRKAEDLLETAVKDYPDYKSYPGYPSSADLWEFLAFTKAKLHKKQEALSAARKAYQIDPSDAKAAFYNNCIENKPFSFQMNLTTGTVTQTFTCQ